MRATNNRGARATQTMRAVVCRVGCTVHRGYAACETARVRTIPTRGGSARVQDHCHHCKSDSDSGESESESFK